MGEQIAEEMTRLQERHKETAKKKHELERQEELTEVARQLTAELLGDKYNSNSVYELKIDEMPVTPLAYAREQVETLTILPSSELNDEVLEYRTEDDASPVRLSDARAAVKKPAKAVRDEYGAVQWEAQQHKDANLGEYIAEAKAMDAERTKSADDSAEQSV